MQSALFLTIMNYVMQWLSITNEPINEFHAPDGVVIQSFPTLFPFGTDDPSYLF